MSQQFMHLASISVSSAFYPIKILFGRWHFSRTDISLGHDDINLKTVLEMLVLIKNCFFVSFVTEQK